VWPDSNSGADSNSNTITNQYARWTNGDTNAGTNGDTNSGTNGNGDTCTDGHT
jgi:hypothetical protein